MKFGALLRGSALSTIVLSGAVTLAFAQEMPNTEETDKDYRLGSITVTATKREQSLQDVPVAVTALSGDLLRNSGVGSVETLATMAPSVTFSQSSNDQNNSVNIRGIGTSVFSQGVESSVSIVVDDVVMARQAVGFQDLVDVQRVEVLRGPQSTLFGKNASAGAISVTTAAPETTFGGRIDITAAEQNEFGLGATLTGPLSDTVSARLTGFYKQYDGHIENLDGRSFNGFENWGLRGKILFEPSDAFSVTLIADYRKSDQDCCAYTVRDTSQATGAAAGLEALLHPIVPGPKNRYARLGAPVYNNSTQSGLSAKAEYEFDNGFTVTSISAYRDYTFENNIDVDNLDMEEPQIGFLTFDLNGGTTELQQTSQEFRLTSPEGERFDFMLGAYGFFLDLDRTFRRRYEIMTAAGGGTRINQSGRLNSTVDTRNLAVFGSGNLHITQDTTLFGGLRFTHERLDYTILRDPANTLVDGDRPFGGVLGTLADVDASTDDSVMTGDIGVRQNFTGDIQAYVRYARGYKGHGIDVEFNAPADVAPVEAETSDAYEIGLKSVLAGGNLILNLALFRTDYDNFQEQATVLLSGAGDVLSTQSLLTNVGSVRTSGIEIEAMATPSDTLTFQGGISYTDASITRYENASCYFRQTAAQGCVPVTLSDGGTPDNPADDIIQNLQDLSGRSLPNAPDWRLTGSVRQEIPLASLPFDGFINLSGRWQSKVNYSLSGDPRAQQDAFAIVNLSFGITDDQDRYTASIFINNLFDEFYAANIFPDPLYGGVLSHYLPRDHTRYVGARLSANF